MRIGHFVPSYRPICDGLAAQIPREQDTLAHRLEYDYRFWAEETSDIVILRNRALKFAIAQECDYLCMQDSDIWSKSDIGAIAIMLETARTTGAAMVAAICGLRREPIVANVEPCYAGKVYEGKKAGTGLVLIDCKQIAEVAAKTKRKPRWFDREYSEDGSEMIIGEDIWFCKALQRAGKKIYIDGRVPTTHARRDVETLDYPGAVTVDRKSPPGNPAENGERQE